jgi:hypothetical protein
LSRRITSCMLGGVILVQLLDGFQWALEELIGLWS